MSHAESCCPECGTKGYLIMPSYNDCKTCLRLRHEYLEKMTQQESAEEKGIKS